MRISVRELESRKRCYLRQSERSGSMAHLEEVRAVPLVDGPHSPNIPSGESTNVPENDYPGRFSNP